MDSLIGKVLSSRYEVIEKVGDGGMGLVYKGRDRLLNRFVAIKTLKNEFSVSEDFLEKFRKEAQASAALSHPNIVNIYDVGMDENTNYIVMEFVDGITLKDFIKKRGSSVTESEIIQIAKQIADALGHAHRNQIIHRDIKSQNILITENMSVKVGDFGIARALSPSTITATKEIMGSVHYSSPEQARGTHVDEKSDIYSLGVIMYEMVTGKLPFVGETPVSVALKHVKEDITPPSSFRNSLSIGLESMIYKCMMKNPTERFQSATELSRDLDIILKNPNAVFDYFDSGTQEFATMVMPDSEEMRQAENESMGRAESDIYDKYSGGEDVGGSLKSKNKRGNAKTGKKGFFGRKDVWIPAIAGICVAAILFSVVFAFLNGKIGPPQGDISVPEVVNLTYTEAALKLEEKKLGVAIVNRMPSQTVPKDCVISQDPAQGTMVNENTIINLTVSDGNEGTQVPNVKGKTLDEAKALIQAAGFSVGTVTTAPDKAVTGKIFEQNPAPPMSAAPGTAIDLKVSEGKGTTVTMPNITKKSQNTAENLLKTLNLNLGNVSYDYSSTISKNLIITQSVASGSQVAEGTSVDVVISKGAQESLTNTTKSYTIPLDSAESDTFMVKVVQSSAAGDSVIYQQRHSKDDGSLDITVTGSGTTTIKIYFNNVLVNKITDQF